MVDIRPSVELVTHLSRKFGELRKPFESRGYLVTCDVHP
jgi:hypothetical protein